MDRGEARDVSAAVVVRGRFQILGNLLRGFDEPGSTAIMSLPDRRLGNVAGRLSEGNRFVRCAASESTSESSLISRPVWRVRKLTELPRLDGTASGWPWDDSKRVIAFERDLNGQPAPGLRARAIAGWMDQHLYLAAEFAMPSGAELKVGPNWGKADGMALSFRSASPGKRGPVWLFWGLFDGTFKIGMTGSASHEQLNAVKNATVYAAHVAKSRWTCEWRLELKAIDLDAGDGRLRFNIGLRSDFEDTWITWAPTGERVLFGWVPTHVDFAGDLQLIP